MIVFIFYTIVATMVTDANPERRKMRGVHKTNAFIVTFDYIIRKPQLRTISDKLDIFVQKLFLRYVNNATVIDQIYRLLKSKLPHAHNDWSQAYD